MAPLVVSPVNLAWVQSAATFEVRGTHSVARQIPASALFDWLEPKIRPAGFNGLGKAIWHLPAGRCGHGRDCLETRLVVVCTSPAIRHHECNATTDFQQVSNSGEIPLTSGPAPGLLTSSVIPQEAPVAHRITGPMGSLLAGVAAAAGHMQDQSLSGPLPPCAPPRQGPVL